MMCNETNTPTRDDLKLMVARARIARDRSIGESVRRAFGALRSARSHGRTDAASGRLRPAAS